MHSAITDSAAPYHEPADPEEADDVSAMGLVLGYLGMLALTLTGAVVISGYAPDVLITVAGI